MLVGTDMDVSVSQLPEAKFSTRYVHASAGTLSKAATCGQRKSEECTFLHDHQSLSPKRGTVGALHFRGAPKPQAKPTSLVQRNI